MDYQYDVAISFLSQDENLARQLKDLLEPGLKVFEFTSRQIDVAGTDGLVTFRETFRDSARLVVVLFRTGWGETPWTRVESEAITDRFLKHGPEFLLFIMVEPGATPPPWVPDRKIRFELEQFGVDQAVGAIKLRVSEQGGRVTQETVGAQARRAAAAQQFAVETERLKVDSQGVQEVQKEGEQLIATIQSLAEEASSSAPELGLQWAVGEGAIGIRTRRASLYVQLVVRYVNTLSDSFLSVRQMGGNIIIPGENKVYIEPPRVVDELRFEPDRMMGVGWCWNDGNKRRSSAEVADHAFRRLLQRLVGGDS